ncbi:hypothetical protein GCM10025787_12850 [Saccharopolyspora rosea]
MPPDRSPTSHAALTRVDAERLLGRTELDAALDDGTWTELWSGVVVPAQFAEDRRTRAAAALLRAGPHAVLSGVTAVAMHGCTAARDDAVHVTIPYDRERRSTADLVFHQAWIRESDVVELDGLRVHALDFATAELLCTGPQRMALACLEQTLDELAGNAEHFRWLVAERLARRRDRRGTRRAAALLELAWSPSSAEEAEPVGGAR